MDPFVIRSMCLDMAFQFGGLMDGDIPALLTRAEELVDWVYDVGGDEGDGFTVVFTPEPLAS